MGMLPAIVDSSRPIGKRWESRASSKDSDVWQHLYMYACRCLFVGGRGVSWVDRHQRFDHSSSVNTLQNTRHGRDIRTLVALLGCALLLAALLAWRAAVAVSAQRTSATRELRDEAEFAAYMFGTHASRDVYWGLIDLFGPVASYDEVRRGGPDVPLATVAGDACEYDYTCDIKTAALAWFRVDPATGASTEFARKDGADVRRSIDSLLARLRMLPPPRFIQLIDARSSGLVAVVGTVAKAADGRAAVYGFEVPARTYASAMIRRSSDGRRPFLPASLKTNVTGALPYALRVTDRLGRVLGGDTAAWNEESNVPWPHARVPLDSIAPSLFAEVALRPAYVARRSNTGASGLTVIGAAFALTAMVVVILGVRLRRLVGETRRRADFTASVSHELRTPLTQILLFGESLSEGSLRSERERRHASDVIVREARRLLALIENLLRFSRAERGVASTAERRQALQTASEIAGVVDDFVSRGAVGKARIVTDLAGDASVVGEPAALRQLVSNLVDNAVKYGPPQQTITVASRTDGAWVRVWVDDQGPGVPASERDRVWDPFVRLERRGNAVVTGTGLGLPVVRQLAQSMDGDAWVEDGPGGGARFVVTLRRST